MSLLDLEVAGPSKRILFVCGSPRKGGNTEVLLQAAQESAEAAGATIDRFYISDGEVSPCVSCEGCFQTGECVIADRMGEFLDLADAADVLVLGTPVYWAGPPAQLKAVIDRFQPRWARRYLLDEPARPKRPMHLLVTRTGADPHGFEPLVTIVRGSFAVLGFSLIETHDFVEGMDNGDPGLGTVPPNHIESARDLGAQLALSEAL